MKNLELREKFHRIRFKSLLCDFDTKYKLSSYRSTEEYYMDCIDLYRASFNHKDSWEELTKYMKDEGHSTYAKSHIKLNKIKQDHVKRQKSSNVRKEINSDSVPKKG